MHSRGRDARATNRAAIGWRDVTPRSAGPDTHRTSKFAPCFWRWKHCPGDRLCESYRTAIGSGIFRPAGIVLDVQRKTEDEMTIWVDATTTAAYPPPTIGVPRVGLNVAAQLRALDPAIRVCVYEARPGRFSELPSAEFERLKTFHSSPSGDRPELSLHRH